ncbi:hypothetical protein Tco_0027647, partial [Tanacetum coccineum]
MLLPMTPSSMTRWSNSSGPWPLSELLGKALQLYWPPLIGLPILSLNHYTKSGSWDQFGSSLAIALISDSQRPKVHD